MGVRHMLKSEQQLAEESVAALFDPKHLVQLPDGNLNADSRQKTDENGAGQEIGEETQTKYSCKEKYPGSH